MAADVENLIFFCWFYIMHGYQILSMSLELNTMRYALLVS